MSLSWTRREYPAGALSTGRHFCKDSYGNIYLFVSLTYTDKNRLYISSNNGDSWTNKGTIGTSTYTAAGIGIFDDNTLYAAINTGSTIYVYYSIDSGDTWTKTTNDPPTTFYYDPISNYVTLIHSRFFVAQNRVYVMCHANYTEIPMGMTITSYTGSWADITKAPLGNSTMLLANPPDGSVILVKHGDGTPIWSGSGISFTEKTGAAVGFSSTTNIIGFNSRCYAVGYNPNLLFKYSDNSGTTWSSSNNFPLVFTSGQNIYNIYVENNLLYLSAKSSNKAVVYQSDAAGTTASMVELAAEGDFGVNPTYTIEIIISSGKIIAAVFSSVLEIFNAILPISSVAPTSVFYGPFLGCFGGPIQ